jgi:hypothetical protein
VAGRENDSGQLREELVDRIFPSEHEIAPTVSNKTKRGQPTTASFFFPLSPPSHSTIQHNDSRPQASPNAFPIFFTLPQATPICAPCLRPANTDARTSLHHPETAAVLSAAQVSTTDDPPQGESETESSIQVIKRKVGRRSPGSYQVTCSRVGQAKVTQGSIQEHFHTR